MKIVSNGKTIEIASRAELTSGDGITIEGKTISVTTPVKGVTQAEYDGLPEEDRKGLFVVTDANTVLPEGGEVYSTEETRIGTWIDGKPIYRKTIVHPQYNGGNGLALVENVDTVVDAYGIAIASSRKMFHIPVSEDANNRIQLSYSGDNLVLSSVGFGTYSITITVEYTKTTDPEVSA